MTTDTITKTTTNNNITITTAHDSDSDALFTPPTRPILDTNVIHTSPKKLAETRTPVVADVFGRPMDPGPAPLVYLNGGPGVGKEAVAECLVLLLGQDKSLLVDVRGVGRDDDDDDDDDDNDDEEEDESLLMTPENPGYFDYDNNNVEYNREGKSPGYFSNIPRSPSTATTNDSTLSASPPCSDKKLARLLDRPGNTFRIAILEFCAFDTPAGHAAMSSFAAAARLAGRLFIPIALTCEPAEQMRRAQSLQRQCSYKNRRNVSISESSGRRPSSSSLSFGENMYGDGGGIGVRRGQSQAQQQLPLARPSSRDYGEGHVHEMGPRTSLNGKGGGVDNKEYELTVDITKTSAFETALHIVELVKKLAAERDAVEQRQQQMLLYGRRGSDSGSEDDSSSVMTTPMGSLGS